MDEREFVGETSADFWYVYGRVFIKPIFLAALIGVAPLPLPAAMLPAYGSTPQSAAERIVYSSNDSKVVIIRTNIVGRYATVLIHGGYVEGAPADDAALLFKHFSFGWQGLESLNFRCRLDSQVRSAQARTQLMRGMPPPLNERACGNTYFVDAGSRAAIDAIRRRQSEPFVTSVVISGNYALVAWYGAGGGETLLQKHANRWNVLTHGGGALSSIEMRRYGVPKTAWCSFGIYDASCALRR